MLDVLVVGLGKMGTIHLAAYHWLATLGMIRRIYVTDIDPARVAAACARWPQSIPCPPNSPPNTSSLSPPACASVCTPPDTHRAVASALIHAGTRALLIEKPITLHTHDADALLTLASSTHTSIWVGHSERFNPALANPTLHRALSTPPTARPPLHLHTWRHAPSHPTPSLDPIRDLMIHDLDLAALFFRSKPSCVNILQNEGESASAVLKWAYGDEARLWVSAHPSADPPTRRLVLAVGEDPIADLDLRWSPCSPPPDPITAQALYVVSRVLGAPVASPTGWPAATGLEGRAALSLAEQLLAQWSPPLDVGGAGWCGI